MDAEDTTTRAALVASDVVGAWGPATHSLCPTTQVPPLECDCGFLGEWEHRWVYVWYEHPGYTRGDRQIRRDLARGMPARWGDEGWWVFGGWDERCPGCGDIERFDRSADRVSTRSEPAQVVRFLSAHRGD